MAAPSTEPDLSYLYPARSVSQSAKQIASDPDLYGMFVSMYQKDYGGFRVDQLNSLRNASKKQRTIPGGQTLTEEEWLTRGLRAILSSDKRPRRQFAVAARKFLSEREAGQKVEAKRLKTGSGRARSAALIKSSQATQPVTALGRSILSAGTSRVRNLMNDANKLGQVGALG